MISLWGNVVAEPQVNTGKRHAQIKIERTSDAHQLVVQAACIESSTQVLRYIQNQGNGGHKLVGAVVAGLGLCGTTGLQCRDFGHLAGGGVDRFARLQANAQGNQEHGQGDEHRFGHARYQTHAQGNRAANQQRTRLRHDLVANVAAHVGEPAFFRLHPGHHDASTDRDEQGWNLRNEAVTDGQDRIGLYRLGGG